MSDALPPPHSPWWAAFATLVGGAVVKAWQEWQRRRNKLEDRRHEDRRLQQDRRYDDALKQLRGEFETFVREHAHLHEDWSIEFQEHLKEAERYRNDVIPSIKADLQKQRQDMSDLRFEILTQVNTNTEKVLAAVNDATVQTQRMLTSRVMENEARLRSIEDSLRRKD